MEKFMNKQENDDFRSALRRQVTTKVEFFVHGDIEQAKVVNISETGIQFVTDEPVKVRMRLELDGEIKEYVAQMIWAKKNAQDASMSYGLQFIPDKDKCVF
jgi:uncharacterized membrane-anchored protein YjiN (DUF445 family)